MEYRSDLCGYGEEYTHLVRTAVIDVCASCRFPSIKNGGTLSRFLSDDES
jgi:hypothetical protein